jgi:hypothetical protein
MLSKNRTLSRKAELGIESLERRSLLSAIHSIAQAPIVAASHAPAIVAPSATAAVVNRLNASHSSGVQASEQNETHLQATLADSTGVNSTTGIVSYESETEHGVVVSQLNVAVKGAAPGDVVSVSIPDANGLPVVVGQFTTATDETGKLTLSSNPHGTLQQPLPANFPAVSAGTVISLSVTDPTTNVTTVIASGAFAAPTSNPEGGHSKNTENETHLSASLADPASTLKACATFETGTEHGLTVTEFKVTVKGGTPGAVIDVAINDGLGNNLSVGQITIGADGTGRLSLSSNPHGKSQLQLPTNFPTVASGSMITLSTVDPVTGATTPITSAALAVSHRT